MTPGCYRGWTAPGRAWFRVAAGYQPAAAMEAGSSPLERAEPWTALGHGALLHRHGRNAQPLHKLGESWIRAQSFEPRVPRHMDEEHRAFVERLDEPSHRLVVIAEARVHDRDVVSRDVALDRLLNERI